MDLVWVLEHWTFEERVDLDAIGQVYDIGHTKACHSFAHRPSMTE